MARRRTTLVAAATATMVATMLPTVGTAQEAPDPREVGAFTGSFVEPDINGEVTDEDCIPGVEERTGQERELCKPAAGTIALMTDGRFLYHNALEGTEEVDLSIVAEFGSDSINDQTRVLDLNDGNPTFFSPQTIDGGAQPDPSGEETILPPGVGNTADVNYNSGALFCSDITMLPDGRLLAAGGTNYYTEPAIADSDGDGDPDGVVELVGLNESRIFDPATSTWSQSGDMNFGRWYPTLVTMADGQTFVASGVTKLLKPVYTSHPLDSGRNVVQTETYDPDTGVWTANGDADEDAEPFTNPANRSLPLYPRLHLLPNGNVYYNAAGQVFNPAGQSFDEPLWNIAATYNPDEEAWTDLGIPGIDTDPTGDPLGEIGGAAGAGFRGSTTSVMQTLKPNDDGVYDEASFLTAGGIIGPSPGTYQAIPFSRIDTVTVDGKETEELTSRNTAPLNSPRWYGMGVLLPDDSTMMFSGATADEVVNPGTGVPVTMTERFDPVTETWEEMVDQGNPRTYHNTALLMPDGRVLVGGHAPISTAYLNNTQLPGLSPPERDPSFQYYSPTYIFEDRPDLSGVSGLFDNGSTVTLETLDADTVTNALIVRQATLTHLVDGDQRAVEVPITRRNDGSVEIEVPDAEVVPPGGYMIFLREENADGELIPSEAKMVTIGEEAVLPAERFDGVDRIETAVKVASGSFDSADTVLLARSDNYPDALAGAPLAAQEEAPLLLTEPTSLNDAVASEIERLGASEVLVLGGPLAISEDVVDELEAADLTVRRIAGENRFGTAVEIADELGATATNAYLAKGADPDPERGWEDALTVAPLAAHEGRPILLTRTDTLPPETAAALTAQQVERVTIVGGPVAVSPAVATAASTGRQANRLAGADRYETSAVVHREAVAAGMGAENLWIATGRNFPDSLAAGPAVAAAGDSLLLVDGQAFSNADRVKPRLEELAGTTTSLTVVGGEDAIRAAVERAVLNLLRAE